MIPKSYKEQRACYNCVFVFIISEYDEEERCHCLYGDPHPRLRCNSVAMDEYFDYLDYKLTRKEYSKHPLTIFRRKCNNFYDCRKVSKHGICNKYKEREGIS